MPTHKQDLRVILIQRPSGDIEIKLPEPITYIYRFLSPNGMSYVGQTKNIPRRISQHLDGEGSQLLLKDLVEHGRKAFTIEILEVLATDDAEIVASVEDSYIEKFDCIYPKGYNKRLNRELVANGQPTDLSNVEITAKYVFQDGGKLCFTVGECSHHRSYQTLLNAGYLSGLEKKRKFKFNFFEIRTEPFDFDFLTPCVYELTLKHENGLWKILTA